MEAISDARRTEPERPRRSIAPRCGSSEYRPHVEAPTVIHWRFPDTVAKQVPTVILVHDRTAEDQTMKRNVRLVLQDRTDHVRAEAMCEHRDMKLGVHLLQIANLTRDPLDRSATRTYWQEEAHNIEISVSDGYDPCVWNLLNNGRNTFRPPRGRSNSVYQEYDVLVRRNILGSLGTRSRWC